MLLQTHPGKHTSIHAHAQAHIHTHAHASTLVHRQGLVPRRGLLLAGLEVCKPLWLTEGWEENRYTVTRVIVPIRFCTSVQAEENGTFPCPICRWHVGMLCCLLSCESTDSSSGNLWRISRSSRSSGAHLGLFSQRQYEAPV